SRAQSELGVRVIQGYGLSEATNFSTTLPIDLPDSIYQAAMIDTPYPSIGTTLRGGTIAILDDSGKELGESAVGEIAIRGWNVALGYKHEPFTGNELRTGDLGHFRFVGGKKHFFLTGRCKDVIKRFGETVSLREIDDLVTAFGINGLDAIAVPFENDLA